MALNDKSKDGKSCFQDLLAYVGNTDLEFVNIEKDGCKVMFRRSGVAPAQAAQAIESQAQEAAQETNKFASIRSPIVGRFHSSTGADRPALVVEGGKVTAGQRVAIVEAMKIRKEVFSAVTGTVARIAVRDGDPVEYGQELFIIEPESEGAGD